MSCAWSSRPSPLQGPCTTTHTPSAEQESGRHWGQPSCLEKGLPGSPSVSPESQEWVLGHPRPISLESEKVRKGVSCYFRDKVKEEPGAMEAGL